MKILRNIFSLIAIFLLPTHGADKANPVVYLDESHPALRQIGTTVSDNEYQKFEKAKKQYFKNFKFNNILELQEIPIFEVTHKSNGNNFIVLGSHHNLPFQVLPCWLSHMIENEIDEVYLTTPHF